MKRTVIDADEPEPDPDPGPLDLEGNDRVMNGRVDMGAFEFHDFGVCGNKIVEPGEDCDPPNGVTCDNDCQILEDADGDGVVDKLDVCDNTPPDTPVDTTGRPIGDLDCDVDLVGYSLLQAAFTGVLP
ncbi:MAG: hypothetical protein V3W34_06495 [Phycisphaerae bacterium]